MKWWKVLLACLAALLLAAALLVWFAPARWLAPWLNARLRGAALQQVEGSLWHGRAGRVLDAQGRELGTLRWTLSRGSLLGHAAGEVALDGPWLALAGRFARDGDAVVWRDVHARLDLAQVEPPPATPFGTPGGQWQVRMEHATLRAGWPESLHGRLDWRAARFTTTSGAVPLGNLFADVDADHGVVTAVLGDGGDGPLQLAGQLRISPLGWRLDATLTPRGDNPALARWLARLGPPDARGAVHLQRGAGLGAIPASTGVSR